MKDNDDDRLHDVDDRDNDNQEDTWEGHASLVKEVAEVLGRPPACLVAAVTILIFSSSYSHKRHIMIMLVLLISIELSLVWYLHHHHLHCYHHHHDKVGGGGLALGLARGLDRQPGTSVHATWHQTR